MKDTPGGRIQAGSWVVSKGPVKMVSGQVYGRIDWVTSNKKEVGMFLRSFNHKQTRCILVGPVIEQLASCGALMKGMLINAHGEFFARHFVRRETNEPEGELVCHAAGIASEPMRHGRLAGAIHAVLKGRVDYWDPRFHQIKTYLGVTPQSKTTNDFTCVVALDGLARRMPVESLEKTIQSLAEGKEFITSCLVQAYAYTDSRGRHVPALRLLPSNFTLQDES
jgi:hypothetical protein